MNATGRGGQPNVLFFHCDQMRADALGCLGNTAARTPHLDRLASDATVFTRHIAANPVCMPSRASLMTGLYPPGHGVWMNGVPLNRKDQVRYNDAYEHWGIEIVPQPATMAEVFAAAGYDTVALGKLHLTPLLAPEEYRFRESQATWKSGRNDSWRGPYYGFRRVELTHGHGEGVCALGHYAQWLKAEHPEVHRRANSDRDSRRRPVPKLNELFPSVVPGPLHNSAWLGRRACDYLARERPKDRPFFLFVGFPDPHHPFTPSHDVAAEFEGREVPPPHDPEGLALRGSPIWKFKPATVAELTPEERLWPIRYTNAMVHQIDAAAGEVLGALRSEGLWENTLVVFTSDHGDFLCDHGLIRKGYWGADELVRVPFLLRAPGAKLPARVETPMSNVDVLPTLAALAGVAPPPDLDGRDIVAAVRRGESRRAFAYSACGRRELVNLTCYDARRRLTWFPGAGHLELYDHAEDPGETRNLADDAAYASVRAELMEALAMETARAWRPNVGAVSAW